MACSSPDAGVGSLVDACVTRLPAGSLRLSTPVTSFRRESALWRLTTSSGVTEILRFRDRHLPAPAAGDPLPTSTKNSPTTLPPRSNTPAPPVVCLTYRRKAEHFKAGAAGRLRLRRSGASTEHTRSVSPAMFPPAKPQAGPPQNEVLIRVFIGGLRDRPRTRDLPTDDLNQMLTESL